MHASSIIYSLPTNWYCTLNSKSYQSYFDNVHRLLVTLLAAKWFPVDYINVLPPNISYPIYTIHSGYRWLPTCIIAIWLPIITRNKYIHNWSTEQCPRRQRSWWCHCICLMKKYKKKGILVPFIFNVLTVPIVCITPSAKIGSDSAWNFCRWFGTKCRQFKQSQSSVRWQHRTVCQSGRSFAEIALFVTIGRWQIDICWQACRSCRWG